MIINNTRKKKFLQNYLFRFALVLGAVFFCQCHKNNQSAITLTAFDSVPLAKPLNPMINEISGIADSKINPGFIWGEEDSGNPSQLYLIRHDGVLHKRVYLKGVSNRDWEDMALFHGDIYIAETGDNAQVYNNYMFYKFPEPSATTDTVTNIESIPFTYPDGAHDAEAFLIDSATKDIYIITKRDNPSKIYRLSYPYNNNGNTVTFAGELPYNGVVSAAVRGNDVIIKTYAGLFYYKRKQNESMEQSLQRPYASLAYTLEPQGEAISFAGDGSGFYTISEKGFAATVNIYFYKRK